MSATRGDAGFNALNSTFTYSARTASRMLPRVTFFAM